MKNYTSIEQAIQDLTAMTSSLYYNLIASTMIGDLKYHCHDQGLTDYLRPLVYLEHNGRRYPFYVANDYLDASKKCLIPVMSGYYEFYSYYHDMIQFYEHEAVGISFPIVERKNMPATFREFLKSCQMDMISHFFGTKSQEVPWSVVSPSVTLASQTADIFMQQSFNYMVKAGDQKHRDLNLLLNWFEDIPTSSAVAIASHGDRLVSAMYLFHIGEGVHCQKIASSKADHLKKYSLTLNAQLAVVREYFFGTNTDYKYIDLGCNFDPQGEYKKVIPYTEYPIINFSADYVKSLLTNWSAL